MEVVWKCAQRLSLTTTAICGYLGDVISLSPINAVGVIVPDFRFSLLLDALTEIWHDLDIVLYLKDHRLLVILGSGGKVDCPSPLDPKLTDQWNTVCHSAMYDYSGHRLITLYSRKLRRGF
jgi:hypothetical protein